MNEKDVCFRLLKAESEAEVTKIIASVPAMQDRSNWQPLDGRDTNFNVTSNQASDAGKALTELMTNMVDAVLMKRAFQEGIDPKGKDAPQTMYEAVDRLVMDKNIPGGKLLSLDSNDRWLREFAQENLVIGLTGAKAKKDGLPCYTFVDNGEGQRGEDFKRTFLSLSAGHKKDIPFVQGRYNMGSSGVLTYCGECWFKLIVSRRYDRDGGWSWTLMRLRPDDGDNLPVAECFFLKEENRVPSFDSDCLYPFHTNAGERYDSVKLETGTVVKLFDYHTRQYPSFGRMRDNLNQNLVETILPFRLLDFRVKPSRTRTGDRAQGVDPRTFYGMECALLRPDQEGDGAGRDGAATADAIPLGTIESAEIGKVSVKAIPLKRELPVWLKSPANNKRVFHACNGQVQYKQSRGYLNQCGFAALKDRVVIIVDASDLTFSAHNRIWMANREQISDNIVSQKYQEKIKATISGSAALKELAEKIALEELARATKAGDDALFEKLVNLDPSLADLLSSRDPKIRAPVSNAGGTGSKASGGEWDGGKYSPTFISLEERSKKSAVDVPIGGERPVAARTDVENGYLNRTDTPGQIIIDADVRAKFGIQGQLHNGRLTIYFEPQEGALAVGDTFNFQIGLKDEGMAEAVESETLVLRVVEERALPSSATKKARNNSQSGGDKADKGNKKTAPSHDLPKCILLTEDGREIEGYAVESWPKDSPDDFSEQDGGIIEDLGERGAVYKINYDNAYHLDYRRQQRDPVSQNTVTAKYILGMRILMLGYERALRSLKDRDGDNKAVDFEDDFRRAAAQAAASTVLTIAENLPKIVDQSSVGDDAE